MLSRQALNPGVGSLFHLDVARGGDLSPELLEAWRSLAKGMERAPSLRQSPEFFDHLRAIDPAETLALAMVRNDSEELAGVVPLRIGRFPLTYHIEGHVLWKCNLRGVELIGGTPCIPDDAKLFDLLFKTLGETFSACDVLALPEVSTESILCKYLHQSNYIKQNFLTYSWSGVNLYHAIELPGTFEKYLGRYKARYRRNIKRQMRILREFGGGKLVLRKIDSCGDIPSLLAFIDGLDWPDDYLQGLHQRRAELASLAERGFFLAYLLFCGTTPCAALIGQKYNSSYSVERIARNRALDRFSPGTTMLQLAIEDLIRGDQIDLVDLGVGWPRYRYSTINVSRPCASIYLLRKTTTNRLLTITHGAFRSAKRWVRRNLL
jgi:CelD/BcsL family acetyltransferase involved in cellulose biosynthesis